MAKGLFGGKNKASESESGDTPVPTAAVAAASGPRAPKFTLKPTKKTCIALGALTGVVLAATGGMYVWQSGQIAALDAQVRAKRAELESSQKIARDLTLVRKTNADTQAQLRYLETSVTEGQYVPTLLRQMEDLAKSVDLKVGSLRPALEPAPKPPTDKELLKKFKPQPYDKLHIDMEISGKYWDIARMLYRLTEFPKIMTVENVQVNPVGAQQTGVSPILSVKMKLTGFIFPNDGTNPVKPPAVPVSATASAGGDAKPATAPAAGAKA